MDTRSLRARLPPDGFTARPRRDATVLRGWDWLRGALSLTHGVLTVGLAVWWAGSLARGLAVWLAVSLLVAAGFGWRLVVDARGFAFARTWLFVPYSWKWLPVGSSVAVVDDPWAPDGADFSEWVVLAEGTSAKCELGTARNAAAIARAIEQAVARHHGAAAKSGPAYR